MSKIRFPLFCVMGIVAASLWACGTQDKSGAGNGDGAVDVSANDAGIDGSVQDARPDDGGSDGAEIDGAEIDGAAQRLYPPDTNPYEHTDRPTDIPMPDFGESFTDPDFGTTVTRITDYDPLYSSGYPKHDYAKREPWNADQTLYRFSSVAIYDAQTFQLVRQLPNLYVAIWSNVDPDIIYGFRPELRRIERYHVSTEQTDLVIDLADRCEYMVLGPGEGNIDAFDGLAAVACRNGSNFDIFVVDLQSGTIHSQRSLTGAWGDPNEHMTTYVDWASISQLGEYVVINWNHNTTSESNPLVIDGEDHFGVEVFDKDSLAFVRRLWHYGNHGDLCVDTAGDDVYVQFNGPSGSYVNMYRLSDGLHTSIISEDQNPAGDIRTDFRNHGGHISCRNLQRPGWAYVSLQHNSDLPNEFVNDGEVLAVKLDGSGTVEHFTHHQSSASTYAKSPMPVPSPDGTTVMFSSDWGDAADPDLVYEFIVRQQ